MKPDYGEFWVVEWIEGGEREVMKYEPWVENIGSWISCALMNERHVSVEDVRAIKRVDLY